MQPAARFLSSHFVARHRGFDSLSSSCNQIHRLFSSDSHDDFKPKAKASPPPVGDVAALIKQDITSNDVFVYMKGVPEAPNCGFSNMVRQMHGVKCFVN
jgi:hypothetical protein